MFLVAGPRHPVRETVAPTQDQYGSSEKENKPNVCDGVRVTSSVLIVLVHTVEGPIPFPSFAHTPHI